VSQAALYDLITMGRSLIDLYSNDIGASFVDIKSFSAYVGGSPTNIAVGAHRLGLKTALLTAVGPDLVGDFILNFLQKEGVDTRYVRASQARAPAPCCLASSLPIVSPWSITAITPPIYN
jgi:5-dehydro-2-deoxygluconokinase